MPHCEAKGNCDSDMEITILITKLPYILENPHHLKHITINARKAVLPKINSCKL